MTIELNAIEFATAREAIEAAKADLHDRAITIEGKNLVLDQEEADRLAASGAYFAYLGEHEMPDGTKRIITVPVN